MQKKQLLWLYYWGANHYRDLFNYYYENIHTKNAMDREKYCKISYIVQMKFFIQDLLTASVMVDIITY